MDFHLFAFIIALYGFHIFWEDNNKTFFRVVVVHTSLIDSTHKFLSILAIPIILLWQKSSLFPIFIVYSRSQHLLSVAIDMNLN